jgi:hypothetical protein
MFKTDAPGRISILGHSTFGIDGAFDAGWLTPEIEPVMS